MTTTDTSTSISTTTSLQLLHDHYVEAVNMAVAGGDDATVARLVTEYDDEARHLGEHGRLAA